MNYIWCDGTHVSNVCVQCNRVLANVSSVKKANIVYSYPTISGWKECALDKECASQCVQNYMKRYAAHYNCPMTCKGFAREHNGGPNGCNKDATLSYWTAVQSHSGCNNVQ